MAVSVFAGNALLIPAYNTMYHFGHDMFSFDGHLIVQAFDKRSYLFCTYKSKAYEERFI